MTYNVLETCLLVPGISYSACASWVQALGSIGGIGVAIWLSRLDAKQRRLDRIDDTIQAALSVYAAPIALIDAFADDITYALNGLFNYQDDWTGAAGWALQTVERLRRDMEDLKPSTLTTVRAIRAARAAKVEIAAALKVLEGLANAAYMLVQPNVVLINKLHEDVAHFRAYADILRTELIVATSTHEQRPPAEPHEALPTSSTSTAM